LYELIMSTFFDLAFLVYPLRQQFSLIVPSSGTAAGFLVASGSDKNDQSGADEAAGDAP
jgi:hypothetical protein